MRIDVTLDEKGRPRVTVTGGGVTATALRRAPWDRLLREAARGRVERLPPARQVRPYGGPTLAFLEEVAAVYRDAVSTGMPPRQAIAARWGKSTATAGRWIREARRHGVLPPAGEQA